MAWTDRLINLFRGQRLAREIEEEMRFHLELRIRDNIAAGMTPEQAARDAAARFGNRTAAAERTRDADLVGWLESVAQDLRFSVAMMRRRPAFTTMAVTLLALGIGASTGMFSLLLATVFRSAPYERSDRLVYRPGARAIGASTPAYCPFEISCNCGSTAAAWIGSLRIAAARGS